MRCLSAPSIMQSRQRLTKRFGAEIESWLDELPDVLGDLAERWHVEWGSLIPRGSMSVAIRSSMPDGRPAVLKVSPGAGTEGLDQRVRRCQRLRLGDEGHAGWVRGR